MSNYVLFADSACDMPEALLREWDVTVCQLSFAFDGDEHIYLNKEMEMPVFYGRMRAKQVVHTAAVNTDTFRCAFEKALQEEKDILYPAFSSALSATCHSAMIAARELQEEYPERRICVIDTKSASVGYGLLLYLAVRQRNSGATWEEMIAFFEGQMGHLCHWFTVDHLTYLKRGGRVSPTAATIGQFLQVKPVLHTDDEGRLIPVSKVRGRRASIAELAEHYGETVLDRSTTVFIGHGDCCEDAVSLATILRERHGATGEIQTFEIGPVIGAHSGPGTLALFFLGERR